MESEYGKGLHYELHTKYIKVMSSSRSGGLCVRCFVVATENDKKFLEGDLLKAAGWNAPARNFARGNVLTGKGVDSVRWTGIG